MDFSGYRQALARHHPGPRIQQHPAELNAVRINGARMVALSAQGAGDTWSQMETFMTNWRSIERLLAEPGPFIYTCTRTTLRPIDLFGHRRGR